MCGVIEMQELSEGEGWFCSSVIGRGSVEALIR